MREPIGQVIKESIKKSGFTQEDFAREMGMTLRNLANLFNKDNLPIDQIVRASKILKEDFIKTYTDWLYENEPHLSELHEIEIHNSGQSGRPLPLIQPQVISFSVNFQGTIDAIASQMPDLIVVIKNEAEKRGIQLV